LLNELAVVKDTLKKGRDIIAYTGNGQSQRVSHCYISVFYLLVYFNDALQGSEGGVCFRAECQLQLYEVCRLGAASGHLVTKEAASYHRFLNSE
jgi:hypothetical protein